MVDNPGNGMEQSTPARSLGAPPGTLTIPAGSPAPTICVMAYGPDDFVEQGGVRVPDLPALREKWPVLWVNVDGLGSEPVLSELAETFGLHRLAMEDVVSLGQRAKTEQYDEHLFVVTHMVSPGRRLGIEQIGLFLLPGVVVTFQERPGDCLSPVRNRIRKKLGRVRGAGADYLAYAILDAVIDQYFPVLEDYGERLEAMEAEVIDRPDSKTIHRVHAAKRDLLRLRRVIWPLRDAVSALLRDESPLIVPETQLYIRDGYDHVSRIIDVVETYRELASDLTGLHQAAVGNQMNAVMKVLTIMATIFIPLTFMAGIYGMNFERMPELKWPWGYPVALGAMAIVALGMLLYFKRKRWL